MSEITDPDSSNAPALPPATATPGDQSKTVDDPALQGEGNYTAARRHRESVENFIDAGKVQPAAEAAEPADAAEAEDLRAAEAEGRGHAKR